MGASSLLHSYCFMLRLLESSRGNMTDPAAAVIPIRGLPSP